MGLFLFLSNFEVLLGTKIAQIDRTRWKGELVEMSKRCMISPDVPENLPFFRLLLFCAIFVFHTDGIFFLNLSLPTGQDTVNLRGPPHSLYIIANLIVVTGANNSPHTSVFFGAGIA